MCRMDLLLSPLSATKNRCGVGCHTLLRIHRWIDRSAYMGNYAGICRPIVRFPLPTSHWMQPIALKICAANACE